MNDQFEVGYNNGFDEGRMLGQKEGYKDGYEDGYRDCQAEYEKRMQKFYVELKELNARVDYLNKLIDEVPL